MVGGLEGELLVNPCRARIALDLLDPCLCIPVCISLLGLL